MLLPDLDPTGSTSKRRGLYFALALFLVCLGAIRIITTYHVFSQTIDEPIHIACGVEWWDRGTYTIEAQHPPLARLAVGLGPYLAGARSPGMQPEQKTEEGNAELFTNNAYWSNLTLARIGILPFYLLACAVVWLWTEKAFGTRAALLATLLFTFLPAILGHSGLATTDVPLTACLGAALLCFVLWIEDPTPLNTVWFGVTTGLAVLSKFSTFAFLPVCVVALLLARAWVFRRHPKPSPQGFRKWSGAVSVCLIIASLVVWAGYRFSLSPLLATSGSRVQEDQVQLTHLFGRHPTLLNAAETLGRAPLPGMMVVRGIMSVRQHNAEGHSTKFLGRWNRTGWWYFFPLLLALKTPLAFLILAIIGSVLVFHAPGAGKTLLRIAPAVFVLAILAFSLSARINIGIRHVLPVFPLLAILAAVAAEAMFAQRKFVAWRALAGGLILWLIISSAFAHPDYLAYFNELVPNRPERIIVESDLDWGQDLHRLSERLRQRGIQKLSLSYFGSADLQKFDLPQFRELPPNEKTQGWIAISVRNFELPADAVPWNTPSGTEYAIPVDLIGSVPAEEGPFSWLKAYTPVERIGKSILLYHIDDLASTKSK